MVQERTNFKKSDAQRACEMRRRKRRLRELQEHELQEWLNKEWWRAAAAKKAQIFAQMAGKPGEWRRYWCEAVKWVNTQAGCEAIGGDMAGEHGWRGFVGTNLPHIWDDQAVARGVREAMPTRPQLKVTAEQVTAWLEKTELKPVETRPGTWRG